MCSQKFETLEEPDRKCLSANEKKWRAQGDDFRTFVGEFVSSLTEECLTYNVLRSMLGV
jgi:hypothetical protein